MRTQANRTILCSIISIAIYIVASRPALLWMHRVWDYELMDMIWEIAEEYVYGNIPLAVIWGVAMIYMEVKVLGFSDDRDDGVALIWQLPFAVLIGIFGWFAACCLCIIHVLIFFGRLLG